MSSLSRIYALLIQLAEAEEQTAPGLVVEAPPGAVAVARRTIHRNGNDTRGCIHDSTARHRRAQKKSIAIEKNSSGGAA